jgi:hypothetical protein
MSMLENQPSRFALTAGGYAREGGPFNSEWDVLLDYRAEISAVVAGEILLWRLPVGILELVEGLDWWMKTALPHSPQLNDFHFVSVDGDEEILSFVESPRGWVVGSDLRYEPDTGAWVRAESAAIPIDSIVASSRTFIESVGQKLYERWGFDLAQFLMTFQKDRRGEVTPS